MPPLPSALPRVCVALGLETPAQLARAAETEYKDGNTFLEFRLDYLRDPTAGVRVITDFLKRYVDVRVVATCRRKEHNGGFRGGIEQQLAILEASAGAGATALDLEIESAERVKRKISQLRDSASLVVSYHNFQNTPALEPVLRRLRKISADAYKIATTARKPSHNLRVLQFVREFTDCPLILFAMSDIGVPSRILAPSQGSLFTYAAPCENNGTAPGQIPAKLMRSLYRCEKIGRRSRVYGVVADPVAHSKSPLIHNRAFQARRIDAVYLPFLIPVSQLADWMTLAANLPVAGFSVTIPHKQRIIRHLDVVEPLAKRIGAVNTVWRRAGKWRGTNTDADGVLRPLSRHVRLPHASILIAGYGGAARAAAIALAEAGATITITGRNAKKALALARVVKGEAVTLSAAQNSRFDVLVHATSVGMSPKPNECLFSEAIPADVVLDMVYNPHETILLKRARQQGCTVIYGAEMLLEQAACQFEIWTGESAPRSVMRSALEQHVQD